MNQTMIKMTDIHKSFGDHPVLAGVNLKAVSYTHLDVYKRQTWNILSFFPQNISANHISTVSYTHLDVYKRQGVRRIIIDLSDKEIMSGKYHATVEISNNTVYMPAAFLRNIGYTVDWDSATRTMTVSYTHLDVYKRQPPEQAYMP